MANILLSTGLFPNDHRKQVYTRQKPLLVREKNAVLGLWSRIYFPIFTSALNILPVPALLNSQNITMKIKNI